MTQNVISQKESDGCSDKYGLMKSRTLCVAYCLAVWGRGIGGGQEGRGVYRSCMNYHSVRIPPITHLHPPAHTNKHTCTHTRLLFLACARFRPSCLAHVFFVSLACVFAFSRARALSLPLPVFLSLSSFPSLSLTLSRSHSCTIRRLVFRNVWTTLLSLMLCCG